MNEHPHHIQQAIRDLSTIRRAIERVEGEGPSRGYLTKVTLGTNLLLQAIAFCLATAILLIELFNNHFNTEVMLASVHDPTLQLIGILEIALGLVALVMGLYYLVHRAAKRSEQEFHRYVARNFIYLSNLSFLFDLFVKFSVVSLLILAKHPEWVSPILMLFTADYLIQGRFFTLPTRESVILGLFLLVASVYQFQSGSPYLIWPLISFSIVCGSSMAYVMITKRAVESDNQVEEVE